MNAPVKPRTFLDPIKEAQAVAAYKATFAADLADDDELLADTIEGQTSLNEVVDAILERIRDNQVIALGVAAVVKKLGERKARAEKSEERDRALLEQVMTIADLEKLVRPTATLSLSKRAAKVAITEESDIPARFWKPGAPTLDNKALTEAVKARAEALAALPDDEDARAAVLAEHPEIPGVTLTNGAPSISIRVN